MPPPVYVLYYGRKFKLDHVIIKQVGVGRIFAYLQDENGKILAVPTVLPIHRQKKLVAKGKQGRG